MHNSKWLPVSVFVNIKPSWGQPRSRTVFKTVHLQYSRSRTFTIFCTSQYACIGTRYTIYRVKKKVSVHLTITVQKNATQLMSWRWPSQNTFGMWTVLYWTRSSRTQFGVSTIGWRLEGDILNITCNFLYCNHQVHRDFLITLYIKLDKLQIKQIKDGYANNITMKMYKMYKNP